MSNGKYADWITEEGLLKLEGWARDGLTDEQIAENVGIATSTLYNWKKGHLEILEALKRGKEVVDRQVENALFKRAMGYEYTERTAKIVDRDKDIIAAERRTFENRYKIDHPEAELQEIKDAAIYAVPTTERIILIETDKQQAPDTTAQIFWLKNRKPNEWRDKKETSLSGGIHLTGKDKEALAEQALSELMLDE